MEREPLSIWSWRRIGRVLGHITSHVQSGLEYGGESRDVGVGVEESRRVGPSQNKQSCTDHFLFHLWLRDSTANRIDLWINVLC